MQRKCKRDGRSAVRAGEGIEVSMERSNEADMTPIARGPQPGVRRDGGLCEEQKWVRVASEGRREPVQVSELLYSIGSWLEKER